MILCLAVVFDKVDDYISNNKKSELVSTAIMLKNIYSSTSFSNTEFINFLTKFEFDDQQQVRFTWVDDRGSVFLDTVGDFKEMDKHHNRPEIVQAIEGDIGYSMRFSETLKRHLLYVAVPIYSPENELSVLRLSIPTELIKIERLGVFQSITIMVLLVILLTLLFSYIFSRTFNTYFKQLITSFQNVKNELTFKPGPVFNREGEIVNTAIKELVDVVDSKQRRYDAEKVEKEMLIKAVQDGVVFLKPNGEILNLNHGAKTLLSYKDQNIAKLKVYDIIRDPLFKTTLCNWDMSLSSKTLMVDLKANTSSVQITMIPVIKDTKLISFILFLQDVTKIHRLENTRKEFVANVSHELKTPITLIKGAIETLLRGESFSKESLYMFYSMIEKHTFRLNVIIDDLLYLSKLENSVENEDGLFQPIHLSEIVNSAKTSLDTFIEKKEINLKIDSFTDVIIDASRDYLLQAIKNLLENAIKYSSNKSTVLLTVTEDNDTIFIAVKDRGIGISQTHAKHIFERFYRVDSARTRERGGAGLGLTIVKYIAKIHNGNIQVNSQLGKGSEFVLSLPKKQ